MRMPSSDSMFRLRNSPCTVVVSGTALRTVPPSMVPTLNVVSSSSLPWGSRVIISAAMRIADRPLLRLNARVSRAARDLDVEPDVLRAGRRDLTGRPLAVEHDCLLAAEQREVEIARAHKTDLLFTRKCHLDGVAWDAIFFDRLQRLDYRGDPRLAVASQYRRPVGYDSLTVNRRLDAAPRLDRVHVSG